ncbi:MAG: site-specific DNA-methyltransferase [Bacteroides sp.]
MNEQTTNSIRAFVQTLRDMFMIDDAAELDFGIYRIMEQKKAEIETFFGLNDESDNNALCHKIESILAEQMGASANAAEIRQQIEDRIRIYREDGYSMDDINRNPKIVELRQKLEDTGDPTVMLPRVLTALNDFFTRYYDKGDFISQRRYLNGGDATYLVPYNGEEVKLHWANADQYYIKTSETFKNYRFKLKNGKEVEFTLKNAVQLKNNEKDQKDWARKFKLWDGVCEPGEEPAPDYMPVQMEDDGVLHIYFTYELMKKKGNEQKTLNNTIFNTLAPIIMEKYRDDYIDLLTIPTDNGVEELRRHINRYTTKNSSDYFIHKNLGDFLRRELDYFLKNEVMHISDLDYNNLRRTLTEAKTIKAVGEEIIQMLAGLEDFQKKLWLKKKFVVQSDYCITLDRVPEELYEEICGNEKQHEEWKQLFSIEEIKATPADMFKPATQGYTGQLTVEFLKENPHLVLDTAFFPVEFKQRLLSSIENIDEECNGLLINSENFQALELLQEKYREKVKCVYIDPPYNIDGDGFVYKDNFRDSTWLSMMNERLDKGRWLMSQDAPIFISIDDKEQSNVKTLCDLNYGVENFYAQVIWQKRTSPDARYNLGAAHDFITVYAKDKESFKGGINKLELSEERASQYKNPDNDPRGEWASVDITGQTGHATNGQYYKITTPSGKEMFPPKGRCWALAESTFKDLVADNRIWFGEDGNARPRQKKFLAESEGANLWTWWSNSEVGHNQEATKELAALFGNSDVFTNPKPVRLINRIITLASKNDSVILDYFAGSGTTGDAVVKLNRENTESNRTFILCEMGDYFNSVTKPRIQKVIYSIDWKDGKPVSREGSSHCFKYIRLEQYEDTLNNLYRDSKDRAWYEEKIGPDTIGYVMDMQSQQNWLHTDWMANPFDVKMKITRGNETREQTIDVVETFNYLIGLYVEKMLWPADGMQVVMGMTRKGKRTMVIWRKTSEVTDEQVKLLLNSLDYKPFKQIYLNGETILGTMLDGRLKQTETEFEYRMFTKD